ncbi:kinase [Nocardia sp. NPDC051321]|uniref:kinase n=1 Tax=Nocardia sp. NPDC051321 TaxID=3364323 RepID=UPI0037A0DF24
MTHGLILYGAPASGKDTVTTALTELDGRFHLYERLKAGPGREMGYRMVTPGELDRLANRGEILWQNSRYGARYAIDRPELSRLFQQGSIPVVHAGQPEVVAAVSIAIDAVNWTVIELRCSRATAEARIIARRTGDTPERLAAWDATPRLTNADLVIDTDSTTPGEAARRVDAAVCAR